MDGIYKIPLFAIFTKWRQISLIWLIFSKNELSLIWSTHCTWNDHLSSLCIPGYQPVPTIYGHLDWSSYGAWSLHASPCQFCSDSLSRKKSCFCEETAPYLERIGNKSESDYRIQFTGKSLLAIWWWVEHFYEKVSLQDSDFTTVKCRNKTSERPIMKYGENSRFCVSLM